MPFDLSLTSLHVAISLVALGFGVAYAADLIRGQHKPTLVILFLSTTLATTLTGYMLPSPPVSPAKVVGALSLVVLAIAVTSLYGFGARGGWRVAYVVSAILAFYLNAFVAVVQAFQKLPALTRLAPSQSEPPFVATQLGLLVCIGLVIWMALRRFRPTVAVA